MWRALLVVVLAGATGCANVAHRMLNRTVDRPPYEVSDEARAFHRTLTVVDLHADSLLWNRDLLAKSTYGHVDVPRMHEGGQAVQVFGLVTHFPFPPRLSGNRVRPDLVDTLARAQRWPRETHCSPFHRALHQARKLARFAERSNGGFRVIRTRGDLDALLEARARGETVVGGMLGLEGAHAFEGKLENLDRLYEAGLRVFGLAHFVDTDHGGSAHGTHKGGLTDLGRQAVARAGELGMVIDLAHSSPEVFRDVLAVAERPVIVSHTGVKATCCTVRNLSDDQIRAVAATGGVIGIGFFEYAVCSDCLADSIRAMRHVAGLVGAEHVALGSDWDGATTSIDCTGLPLVTQQLLESGFTRDEVRAIMGGNALRVLRAVLPD